MMNGGASIKVKTAPVPPLAVGRRLIFSAQDADNDLHIFVFGRYRKPVVGSFLPDGCGADRSGLIV
jgi:hypothetical protein